MKNKLITTTLCLFAVVTVYAQHEFSVNVFGGFQPINFSLTEGTHSGSMGFGAGIGYNYNFNKSWSIGTGLDISSYGASMELGSYDKTIKYFDNSQAPLWDFKATATGLKEDMSALLLEIPLTARYTLPLDKTNSLQFIGGFKFGLPISSKYTVSANNLETRGYFWDEYMEYHDVWEVFRREAIEESGSWDAKMSIMLTLEAAYRLAIGEDYGLSFGIYFNYGLNDMQGTKDKNPIDFPIDFDVNSGKPPYSTNSVLDTGLASSIRPMAIGLRIRFDIGL